MNNPQQGSWPDKVPPIGTGEGESPLAKTFPDQPFDMRTMNSDAKSVSESGGSPTPKPYTPPSASIPKPSQPPQEKPHPYIPPPPIRPTPPSVVPPTPPRSPMPPIQPLGMSAGFPPPPSQQTPSQPPTFSPSGFPPPPSPRPPMPPAPVSSRDIFKPPQVETMKASTINPGNPTLKTPSSSSDMPKKSGGKGILIGVIVGIIVLGVVAYFVYPSLLSKPQIDENVPAPIESVTENQQEEIIQEPITETETTITPEPITVPHVSLFTMPAKEMIEADVTPFSLTTWKSIFGGETSTAPTLKEIVATDGDAVITFSSLVATLFPGAFDQSIVDGFEQNVTVFSYVDSSGIWPGFVANYDSSNGSVSLSSLQNSFKTALEQFTPGSLTSLYAADPGTPQTWKQGKTGDVLNRYIIFSAQNSAISMNYGWLGNSLIVSASYDGFKEAIKHLR